MAKHAHQNTRAGSTDRYLHALLLLTDHGQQADTGDVAARVGVSAAAASRMLKNLASKKLVNLEPYRGAELTREGLHRALRVVRRHRLLEVFLHQVMGFDLRETHRRALNLQPCVDEAFEEKLDAMLGRPVIDPHGQPIPARNVTWPRLADCQLLDLPAGTPGRISRVTSEDSEALRYLASVRLKPGARILLESIAPFEGPAAIRIGQRAIHLGRRLAQLIWVCEESKRTVRPNRERPAPKKHLRSTGKLRPTARKPST